MKKVDSHNAALRAKEAQEKAERNLEELNSRSWEYGRLCERGFENGRRRRRDHNDPEGEERDSKRKRNRSRARSPDREKRRKSRHRSGDRDRSKTRRHRSHRGEKDRREKDKSSARSDRSSARAKNEHARRGSHEKTSRDSRHHHHDHHHRRSSHVRTKHHTQDHDLHKGREVHNQSEECEEGPTSDSLEAIIGPAPLPRARGRGASGASAMDARFDEGYDPSQDGRPDPDPKDVSNAAIQAYRERQKSKARLRQAGLSEDFIASWEDRDKKDTESIQWKGKGKVREWDRGKVVGGSGETLLKSPWASS